jgi:hypothetical protein
MPMDSWWDGAAKLLSAGPLGLGAIIVLVTGTVLVTGRAIEEGRLKLSLSLLGAGSILVIAGLLVLVLQSYSAKSEAEARVASTQHRLWFRIDPLASEKHLPAPEITINGTKLDNMSYIVRSDTTVIIDVTEALRGASQQGAQTGANSKEVADVAGKRNRSQLSSDIDTSIAQTQRIVQLMTQSCTGGKSGVNPWHYEDLVALTNSITNSLQKTKLAIMTADF